MDKPRNILQLKKWASENIGRKLFLHYDQRRAVRKILTLTNSNASSLHFIDDSGGAFKIPYPKKGHWKFTSESFSLKTMIFKYKLPEEKNSQTESNIDISNKKTTRDLSEMTFGELDLETSTKIIQKLWDLAYKHGYTNSGTALILPKQASEVIRCCPTLLSQLMIFGTVFKYSASQGRFFGPVRVYGPDGFNKEFIKGIPIGNQLDSLDYDKKFDLVIGIPGYGDQEFEKLSTHELQVTEANTLAEYYIARGLDLLKPGGVLVYHICANAYEGEKLFLDSAGNNCKDRVAAKTDMLDAYRLPTFTSSSDILNSEIVILTRAEY